MRIAYYMANGESPFVGLVKQLVIQNGFNFRASNGSNLVESDHDSDIDAVACDEQVLDQVSALYAQRSEPLNADGEPNDAFRKATPVHVVPAGSDEQGVTSVLSKIVKSLRVTDVDKLEQDEKDAEQAKAEAELAAKLAKEAEDAAKAEAEAAEKRAASNKAKK